MVTTRPYRQVQVRRMLALQIGGTALSDEAPQREHAQSRLVGGVGLESYDRQWQLRWAGSVRLLSGWAPTVRPVEPSRLRPRCRERPRGHQRPVFFLASRRSPGTLLGCPA
jgi:hypothetical protein